jgi:predicted  nucleic acid-binding Zn-ribbon protein
MSEQTPSQQLAAEIDSLRRDLDDLRAKANLQEQRDAIGRLDETVSEVRRRLADVRQRGYKHDRELDARVEELVRRWAEERPHVLREVERAAYALEREFRPLEGEIVRLAERGARAFDAARQTQTSKAGAESLKGRIEAEARAVQSLSQPFENEASQIGSLLVQIEWSFQQLAEASFPLQEGESLVRAVKATLVRGEKESKEDPKGILFLSDRRLLFERKQDVATKKVLFITTQKQRVQGLLFQATLDKVHQVRALKAGLLGHEDHIEVDLPDGTAHFHLDGQDSALWQRLLSH